MNAHAGASETEELLTYLERANSATICADLHVHTTVSDGSDTFSEVLAQAAMRHITHVAFTNHDTTCGLDAAIDLGEAYGVEVIGGVEISAWDAARKRKVHVLGLGLTSASPAVEALCAPVLKRRSENSQWQLDRMLEAGYAVDADRVHEHALASTALYKQHLMAALTSEPYGSDAYQTLYRMLFKGSGICARDIEYVDACDAVAAIVEDGGVAVLAHPGQLDSYAIADDLVACGLRGIEKYHPDHGLKDWAACAMLADRYDLVCTGGSDYHGRFGRIPHLGFRG
ncbi:PHP domain-containing protein [Raoultibacter phocaeensis]|uniref:PHP domain-containing protein n=1 Tax=Raoultibacter phocaeensis TaxID=2479841 RepID=UPI002103D36E|nr:PHP domain-containing protein [Raoultibacter phocaeensis]